MTADESRRFMKIVEMMDDRKVELSMEAERTRTGIDLATSRSPLDFSDTEFLIELAGRDKGRQTS